MNYFNESLTKYLTKHGLLETALEYARTNAVSIEHLGYGKGQSSLWWAFSWSNTIEGYAYWSNHHERYLQIERLKAV